MKVKIVPLGTVLAFWIAFLFLIRQLLKAFYKIENSQGFFKNEKKIITLKMWQYLIFKTIASDSLNIVSKPS